MRRTLLVLSALAATLAPVSASAEEAVDEEIEQTIALSSPDVPTASCELTVYARLQGVRIDGIVSGTWSFYGNTTCTVPMTYQSVGSWLYKSGVVKSSGYDSCTLNLPSNTCQVVHAAGAHTCSSCNGVWVAQSKHRIVFPAGQAWAVANPNCIGTASEINCTLEAATTVS